MLAILKEATQGTKIRLRSDAKDVIQDCLKGDTHTHTHTQQMQRERRERESEREREGNAFVDCSSLLSVSCVFFCFFFVLFNFTRIHGTVVLRGQPDLHEQEDDCAHTRSHHHSSFGDQPSDRNKEKSLNVSGFISSLYITGSRI